MAGSLPPLLMQASLWTFLGSCVPSGAGPAAAPRDHSIQVHNPISQCLRFLDQSLEREKVMGFWPARDWLPWAICLPLVQSLWPGKGTRRTKAAPCRVGWVDCTKGRLGRESSLTYAPSSDVEGCLWLCVRVELPGHLINPSTHS